MKDRIRQFIAHDLLNEPARLIDDDEDLLGSGLLDSLSVMSLVHFLEQEARVVVPAEDVTIDNFVSLSAIEAYLTRRGAGL